LRRIALAIGIKPEASASAGRSATQNPRQAEQSIEQAMDQARGAGMAIAHGRPDDPMLSFLGL
jgi:hypothetical protein